jgi:mitochondrial translocator assembly and maintenance protein 41
MIVFCYFTFLFFQNDLYAKICSLSYMGDLRMLFAEDKNKVSTDILEHFFFSRSSILPVTF